MERLNFHAALCHHIARNGGVYTARKEQQTVSVCGNGKSSCTLDGARADIGIFFTHLDLNGHVGIVNVNLDAVAQGQNQSAHLCGDLRGFEREALIRTLGFHLEGLFALKELRDVLADNS